eukprot:CAMPEP_0171011966 /NCGR_PEP_ID=MMETSP0736-20130129/23236_1 /TAXON_ID=186038 /ORGANISM="Fragilariopsis kerguelensis, Strain L26-C5" /LENGTH=76 /DNA_ID=CAMNT_0011444881 /DNA_START=376 /DNA_END=604 /DNA_ORIENTATION=+
MKEQARIATRHEEARMMGNKNNVWKKEQEWRNDKKSAEIALNKNDSFINEEKRRTLFRSEEDHGKNVDDDVDDDDD